MKRLAFIFLATFFIFVSFGSARAVVIHYDSPEGQSGSIEFKQLMAGQPSIRSDSEDTFGFWFINFSDVPAYEFASMSEIEEMFRSDLPPSVATYIKEVSYGRGNILFGESWEIKPGKKSDFPNLEIGPNEVDPGKVWDSVFQLSRESLGRAIEQYGESAVSYSNLVFIINGFVSYAFGGKICLDYNGKSYCFKAIWLSQGKGTEESSDRIRMVTIDTAAHEWGHCSGVTNSGLPPGSLAGLFHLSCGGNEYGCRWDPMGSTFCYAQDNMWGCIPIHYSSWYKWLLGWITQEEIIYTGKGKYVLEVNLLASLQSETKMVIIPIDRNSFLVLEARGPVEGAFYENIPKIKAGVIPYLVRIGADGIYSAESLPGFCSDSLKPGKGTDFGNIRIDVLEKTNSGYQISIVNDNSPDIASPVLRYYTDGVELFTWWTADPWVWAQGGYRIWFAPYPEMSYVAELFVGNVNSLSVFLWSGAAFYVAVQPDFEEDFHKLSNIISPRVF